MKTHSLLGLVLISSIFVTSCASSLKKKCEATNWAQYGESVAKRGQRVSSDTFIQECEKEEVNIDRALLSNGYKKGLEEYCTPDFAYRLGKQGEFTSEEMCSGWSGEKQMKSKHAEGVKEYCQAANGVIAGTSGKKYNQICPKELEGAFIPLFNQGRKKYLSGLIVQKDGEVQDLDREIGDLDRKRSGIIMEIDRLDRDKTLSHKITTDPKTGARVEELSSQTAKSAESQIQSYRWELQKMDSDIEDKRNHQRALRQESREAQGELLTL